MRFLGWTLAMLLSAAPALARDGGTGDVAGNGGDGFSVGDAVQLFDDIEFADDFVPSARPEYQAALAPQLARIRNELRLPAFARVLEDSLLGRTTLWHFVNVRLRDVGDEGSSNVVVLAYKKVQIAVNKGNLVQIDRAAFDAMSADARAHLLLHEALWTALDGVVGPHGDVVRQLVALVGRASLPPRPNFINFVRDIVGDQRLTPLLAALNEDAPGLPRTGCRSDLAGRFVSTGGGCKDVTSGLIWSKGRSDQDLGVAGTFAGRALLPNTGSAHHFAETVRPYQNTTFCHQLRDGGYSDWQTATAAQLFTLDSESVAEALGMTPKALLAERLWIVDESYYLRAQPERVPRRGEIYLRSLERATWDVIPFAPSGLIGTFTDGDGTLLTTPILAPGLEGLPGYAVMCVRGR